MKIIGLTGQSGAGKSAVADILISNGYSVLNADKIYHSLISVGSQLSSCLATEFGNDILSNGAVDRKKLSNIVFNDMEALKKLNTITHSAVIKETERQIALLEKDGHDVVFYDAPQLFESGFDKRCDHIIGVLSDENIRLHRIIDRDGLDEESVLNRFRNQKTEDFFKKNCDILIYNNGEAAELEKKVAAVAKLWS